MSEFGRSPRLNKDAGRDHWPEVQSILLAGAGTPAGRSTVRPTGSPPPASGPVTPPDLGQTLLHLLGVPDDLVLHDPRRPIRASLGRVNEKLIG